MKILALMAALLITTTTQLSFAASAQPVETELINALRLKKPNGTERVGDARTVIRAFAKEGVVGDKPNTRADYTDYYLLKKPATLMGHSIVVLEEEYMGKTYIGCCVSPGLGVTVKVVGATSSLEQFASKNRCRVTMNVHLQQELKAVGIASVFPKGNYATLSCRERDAEK